MQILFLQIDYNTKRSIYRTTYIKIGDGSSQFFFVFAAFLFQLIPPIRLNKNATNY